MSVPVERWYPGWGGSLSGGACLLITTLCLWKLNLFIWLLPPRAHRAGRAAGPSVLVKRRRCDYDITYCTSSKRHHFWGCLTRAPRRGKCPSSFALPVAGRGYGQSLILCVLAVIPWVHACVFVVVGMYLCLVLWLFLRVHVCGPSKTY